MKTRSTTYLLCLTTLAAGALTAAAWTQQDPAGKPQQSSPGERNFPDLLGGLKSTEGCLGVETAQTASGKNVIFAWFKDKPSVVKWYYSETHQTVLDLFVTDDEYPQHKPLEKIADAAGPIMVVASMTPADTPHFEGLAIPVSQIAIELYEALPGGAYLGSRFAPDSVKVEDMEDITP